MKTTGFTLETTAQVLIRFFWIGFALLILSSVGFIACAPLAFEVVQNWYSISRNEFDLILFQSNIVWKMMVFAALVLYLAIQLVLRQELSKPGADKPG